ncbi:MAG: hypothetical protein ACRDQ1_17755, partial [Sciscionella sp.]
MLVVLGASFRNLDLSALDRLTSGAADASGPLRAQASDAASPIDGFVVLSTCNRFEVYVDANRFHEAVDTVTAAVAAAAGWPDDTAAAALQALVDLGAAEH